MKREFKEALANYIEPINLSANTTRIRLGLPPVDFTTREDIAHKLDYFEKGFNEGAAGFWDRWYEDKIDFKAYQSGNFAGREFFKGEFQTIGH